MIYRFDQDICRPNVGYFSLPNLIVWIALLGRSARGDTIMLAIMLYYVLLYGNHSSAPSVLNANIIMNSELSVEVNFFFFNSSAVSYQE